MTFSDRKMIIKLIQADRIKVGDSMMYFRPETELPPGRKPNQVSVSSGLVEKRFMPDEGGYRYFYTAKWMHIPVDSITRHGNSLIIVLKRRGYDNLSDMVREVIVERTALVGWMVGYAPEGWTNKR